VRAAYGQRASPYERDGFAIITLIALQQFDPKPDYP